MTKEQIKEYTLRTTQANHSGLILVLFDVEKTYLLDGLACYDKDDIECYLRNIELAKKAHNELMASINPRDVLGVRVLAILRFIYSKLVNSSVRRKPDELDRCIAMMDKLRVCFERLHELDDEEPVMKNTHQVYAGLTYGKGVLNESYGNADYSTRGFQA
ncbi:MAG: flagellar protein FliS [Wujia sp.]